MEIIVLFIGQVVESMFSIFTVFHIIKLVSKSFQKISMKKYLLSLSIITITSFVLKYVTIYFSLHVWIKDILGTIILAYTIASIYKISWLQSSLCTIAGACLYACVNLVLLIISKVFTFDFINLYTRFDVSATLSCIIPAISYSVTLLVSSIFKKCQIEYELDDKKVTCIFPQILTFTICLFCTVFFVVASNFRYSIEFILINAVELLFIGLITFWNTKETLTHEHTKLELVNTLAYNETLKKVNDGVRGFKHDMGNIVQAILGYAALKDVDGIKKYCSNLVMGFNDINVLSILSPEVINEPAIYGIVASKILIAREKCMSLSLDVCTDVKKINFPKYELSIIFGILLDNAIEAGEKTQDKKLVLNIYHDANNNSDIICIGNSILDTNIDVEKIFTKDFSTKTNPSGFGLFEVKEFIYKNKQSSISTDIYQKDKMFFQTIIIHGKM